MKKLSAAAALSLLLLGACTEVDDRLGSNLVPGNQQMEVEVVTFDDGVNTYLYRPDSVSSSRIGRAVLGRTIDANGIFGARTGSAVLQFSPLAIPYTDAEGFGIDPIVDSMYILFSILETEGDTLRTQRFDVYDMTDGPVKLHRDSTYYTNFPIEKYRGEKLFEFSHRGRRDVAARLFPTAAGRKYIDSLVYLDWDAYKDDSLFTRKFNGLYITPAEDSPTDASLFAADLAASGIRLYVRNHDTIDVSAIYDTVTAVYSFADNNQTDETTGTTIEWNNVSINIPTADYTGSVVGGLQIQTDNFTDTLTTSLPRGMVYVQPMGGVGTMLRFTDQMADRLRNLKLGGKDIMINQAMMRIWLEDDSTSSLDASMERLGSYTAFPVLSPIPDYLYNEEVVTQASDASYMLPYNGYLNRSNSYYELDITSYVQLTMKEKEGDPEFRYINPVIYLGPEAFGVFDFGTSTMKGTGSDAPITIRLTYTTIEE